MSDDHGAQAPTDATATEKSKAASLFDIRRIIGGLFLLYGLILLVAGILDGASASKKAAGIDINVWTGLGMAVFGALFLLWMRLKPLTPEPVPDESAPADDDRPRPAH